ncbi:hypothetical protein T492DRAFT_537058 [Pavlovales sp. CCMP2436]|nr:hypothetical protein T492DRAFT_515994 [Pavlovales sp. CCMP2436]KAJ1633752.1 hypothetical protein T492DRAFT_537058 [Pavlovales sp. CCMP2436]
MFCEQAANVQRPSPGRHRRAADAEEPLAAAARVCVSRPPRMRVSTDRRAASVSPPLTRACTGLGGQALRPHTPREGQAASLRLVCALLVVLLRLVLLRPALAAPLVDRPHLPHARAPAKARHVAAGALQPSLLAAAGAACRGDLAPVGLLAEEPERLETNGNKA